MNRYFLIPIIVFFSIISGFVFYLQVINDDWKFLVPPRILPDVCKDNEKVKLITHDEDLISGRSFNDMSDNFYGNQFHAILLLPCETKDRGFDVNLNIEYSLLAINKWFFNKTQKQKILFDRNNKGKIDVTFLRVNKTMNWFDNKDDKNNTINISVSDKIKKIILNNKNKFNNFENKKFIIFFEGWEKRKYINYDICGKSTFHGKIAIYFISSRFKKYIGNDLILKNNKRIFTCTKDDHLNDTNDLTFGNAEVTILHEMLHSLGFPSKCSKNLDINNQHVTDSEKDILHKISGNKYLDYNNDDYYNHEINGCKDLKDSDYLVYK